ncbi:MAG: ribokinase [Parasporobacterium sp.]|nr:ribokinase [Parasporobacterium sp.]
MKIAVVGSINTDMTVTAERIPGKGETVKGSSLSFIPGGKGANQAVAMSRLGAVVEMFGCVGDDDNGRMMLDNFKANNVICSHIKVLPGVPTGAALITVGDNDNTIVVVAGANGCVDREYIDSVKNELLTYDMVVLQHEIPMDTVEYVVDICAENGIKIVLNPAPADKVPVEIINKVDYLTPNEHECALIFGDRPFFELLKEFPEKLIVTLGSDGAAVCLKEGNILHVPAKAAKIVDTTGAGDTLNGAFAVKICEGADTGAALKFANAAAGLSCERFGAQGGMPYREEVENNL